MLPAASCSTSACIQQPVLQSELASVLAVRACADPRLSVLPLPLTRHCLLLPHCSLSWLWWSVPPPARAMPGWTTTLSVKPPSTSRSTLSERLPGPKFRVVIKMGFGLPKPRADRPNLPNFPAAGITCRMSITRCTPTSAATTWRCPASPPSSRRQVAYWWLQWCVLVWWLHAVVRERLAERLRLLAPRCLASLLLQQVGWTQLRSRTNRVVRQVATACELTCHRYCRPLSPRLSRRARRSGTTPSCLSTLG